MKITIKQLKERIDELIELNGENQEVFVSFDVSTCDEDSDHRMFGNILEIIDHGDYGVSIAAELTEDNYENR